MRNIEFSSPVFGVKPTQTNYGFGLRSSSSFFGESRLLSVLSEGSVELDEYVENEYHRLTVAERTRMFEIISHHIFLKKPCADYRLLKARFNPYNQYKVKTVYIGKMEVFECFKYEGKFHMGKRLYIKESLITEVRRLGPHSLVVNGEC